MTTDLHDNRCELSSTVKVTRSSATAEKQHVSCLGGLGPPAHSPSVPCGKHLCVWLNPKPATNVCQTCRPLSALAL